MRWQYLAEAGGGAHAGGEATLRRTDVKRFFLLAVVAISLAGGASLAGEANSRRIIVSGEGRAEAVPDMAMLTLGVSDQGREARAVMAAVSDAAARILARLEALGVAGRDVQTRELLLSPVWSDNTADGRARVVGYRASNTVQVRLRDLSALGRILDEVSAAGGNDFRGLSFGVQDPAPLLERARRAAVADAMARAEVLADAAGVRLGPLLELSEAGASPQPPGAMQAAAMREGAPLARGEITIRASVRMVFAIAQ